RAAATGRPDARRSVALRGEGARAGVRRLSRISRLRDAAALVGRDLRAANAGDARAVRHRIDGRGLVLERSLYERGRTTGLRRSQRLHGGPCVLRAATGTPRREVPARALADDHD